jgi:hypothetical protein
MDSLHGAWSPRLAAQSTGKADGWSHNVSAVLSRASTPADRTITDSTPNNQRSTPSHEDNVADSLNLSPRLNWTTADGDSVALQTIATVNRRAIDYRSQEAVQLGAPGDFAEVRSRFHMRGYFLRSELTWQRTLASGAQWELRLGGTKAPRDTDFDFTGLPLAGTGPTVRHVDGDIREHGFNYGGKYSHPLGNGHALVAGWDGSATQRMQTRIEHEYNYAGALNFCATTATTAASNAWPPLPRMNGSATQTPGLPGCAGKPCAPRRTTAALLRYASAAPSSAPFCNGCASCPATASCAWAQAAATRRPICLT